MGDAYKVIQDGEASIVCGAWALLVVEGAVRVCFADTTLRITSGYVNGAPDAADDPEATSYAIQAGDDCRGVLLVLDSRAGYPTGELARLPDGVRLVAEDAFFVPGRDERLRCSAAQYLSQLLRYVPMDADGETNGAGALDHASFSGETWPLPLLPEHPVIQGACQLLRQSPQSPWTLEELARRTETDRRKMLAAFSKEGLPPPMQYLAQVRIALACRLLAENEHAIASIAAQCGYADVAGFSHFFRRHTGKSPRQYRQDAAWLS